MTANDLRMTWLGAAGWLLEHQAATLAIDPFFHRPPAARPALPIGRDDLPAIDYLLVTHGHWDHFADVPYLAATRARHSYVPAATLLDLHVGWRLTPRARRVGPRSWHGVRGGERIELDGLTIRFEAIGTERFDAWMFGDALAKLRRRGSWRDWISAGRFVASHLYGRCFAIVLELHDPARTVVFFGNLTTDAGRLAQRRSAIDLAVLPYCPANRDWLAESRSLVDQLRPGAVLVHHFDQFLPPVTVGLDLPGYRRGLEEGRPGMPVHIPKFYRPFTLGDLVAGAAADRVPA